MLEWVLLMATAIVLWNLRLRLGFCLLLGVIWAGVYANWRLADRLADGL